MYAKVYGETTCGINGEQIIVEVDISNGLPSFDLSLIHISEPTRPY